MLVNEKNTVVAKTEQILPGDHLSKAKYTEVIERQLLDGESSDEIIKLCVTSNIEMKKCEAMRDVAFSRDIRPKFACILKDNSNCADALRNNEVDAMVVQAKNFGKVNLDNLKPLLFEAFDEDDKFVVLADDGISLKDVKTASL